MTNDAIPVISRTLPGGSMIEALYDPDAETTTLAVRDADGRVHKEDEWTLPSGERVVPYSPRNNLLSSGCVLLPSDVGELRDKGDLVDDIRAFLRRYVDLTPTFEAIAAHYVLLTWVYDAFNELPYLRFRGNFGTGKTRALLSVGSLCYKPFFASGASTVSPIFHVIDAFGGTLVLDEADFRFSDATSELTKILNNGTIRGLPVLRTMTNRHKELNPTAFRVFGPKVVAMRERFADRALESRFLTEETGGRPLPNDIPVHIPDSLAVEARGLRNKLLAWRFHARDDIAVDPARRLSDVSPRLNQTALALLSLVDDETLREKIAARLLEEDGDETVNDDPSEDIRIVRAVRDAFGDVQTPFVTIATVADRFNKTRENFHLPLNNKAVGALVRRLGFETTKSRGVYVISQRERAKLIALCARYGIDGGAHDSNAGELAA